MDHEKQKASTSIRLPLSKQLREQDQPPWGQKIFRLSRSLDTVILEEGKKSAIVKDVAGFLQLSERRWHHDRGIPIAEAISIMGLRALARPA